MSLLLSGQALDARRAVALTALQPLAASLAADLRAVIARPLYIPEEKALLSREGGRCARDGTMLDFDPFSPHEHRCPRCGETYRGELHDRFWIYWYQLWLAERAVHAATLARLGVLPEAETFAARVLDGYSDQYLRYPNVDNALGPTRPFFSTYLESIWLLQLCVASSLLPRDALSGQAISRFQEKVVEPSLALIESFDEGGSNRQVWNNASMMAANLSLDRPERAARVLWAESGIAYHLGASLLEDGTWYEGENYHLFAHRGLWYAVQLADAARFELPEELIRRYERGFVTPFLTALPDLTFPSRRDSQYAISLRQWRFAEWCELGLARTDDRILGGMLSRMYADDVPAGDTGRWKSTAEAERNLPPAKLSRGDLGWKSLLFARESIDLAAGRSLPSVLLDAQGIGVIRRDAGQVYVALDYGVSGGGHGHPDRLNLTVSDGGRRVLDDMGTGSYVDPSLHWYRSTLAHNAPMFDGRSQSRVDGELVAFEDRGAAGWMSAHAPIARGASATRTVVVMPDYLVDEVTWSADGPRVFDLPLHFDITTARLEGGSPTTARRLDGADGLEDGFRFLRDARCVLEIGAGRDAHLAWPDAELWLSADADVELWEARAPGPPGRGAKGMMLLRSRASSGAIRWAWSWSGSVKTAALFPHPVIETGGERHEHFRVAHGWQVAIHVAGAKSTIDLEGLSPVAAVSGDRVEQPAAPIQGKGALLWNKSPREFALDESHYRRSEQTWAEAGAPMAIVTIERAGDYVGLRVVVNAERTFAPPGAVNRLDNESADINGAGLQLYLQSGQQTAGYVIVPLERRHELSLRPIDGWGAGIPIEGWWQPSDDGYQVDLRFKPESEVFLMDLIVNERPTGRERRRGQLVMSGAKREFIYLRGDRHDASRLIPFAMIDD
jgi:hypothetical protein